MRNTTQAAILEAAKGSAEGRLHFGEVVGLLVQAGVESYFADYRAQGTTYYLPDGDTIRLETEMPGVAIAEVFDVEGIKSAIRGAQQGAVMYPEFKRLSIQAGCIGYMVWIAGRHVTYFGRRGETHVERFPN